MTDLNPQRRWRQILCIVSGSCHFEVRDGLKIAAFDDEIISQLCPLVRNSCQYTIYCNYCLKRQHDRAIQNQGMIASDLHLHTFGFESANTEMQKKKTQSAF